MMTMPSNLQPVGAGVIHEVGVPVVNSMTIPEFEGAAADAMRRKGRELVSRLDLLANNVHVLGEYGDHLDHVVRTYTSTEGLLKKEDNMDELWYHASPGWLSGKGTGTIVEDIQAAEGEIKGIVTDKGVWGKDRLSSPTTRVIDGLVDQYDSTFHGAATAAINEGVDPTSGSIRSIPTENAVRTGQVGEVSMTMSAFNADGVTGRFQDRDFLPGSSALDKLLAGESKSLSESAFIESKSAPASASTSTTDAEGSGAAAAAGGSGAAAPRIGGFGGGASGFGGSAGPGASATSGLTRVGAPGFEKVSADDIYKQLIAAGVSEEQARKQADRYRLDGADKYTTYAPKTSTSGSGASGYAPYVPGGSGTTPGYSSGGGYGSYTPYVPPSSGGTHLSGYSTPPSLSAGSGYTPYSSGASAYRPYTAGGMTSGPGAVSGMTGGVSGGTAGAGLTPMSGSSLRDMVNRLTAPLGGGGVGAGFSPGAAGVASSPGAGMRMPGNASTMGTGESGSRSTAGTTPSGAGGVRAGSGGSAGSGGMRGGMPMMPMGGMGGMGGGGAGKKEKENAKIKNADGDLYGSDVASVTPVISVNGENQNRPDSRKEA